MVDSYNMGYQFVWFVGVVEDIDDPKQLGRMKVRCVGYHTEDKHQLTKEDLPWATPMQPVTSAAMQGIGQSPTGIVQGTHVVGFFRDGVEAQDPIIMGTLGGIPQSVPKGIEGFEDPAKKYPSSLNTNSGHKINESDVNRLARGGTHTSTFTNKEKNRTKLIDMGDEIDPDSELTWDELKSTYAATYPNNQVFETKAGHVKEYDNTPDKERIHEYHKKGTFYEIDADGNKVTRIVGSNYEIVAGSDFANVKGSVNLKIDENCNTYIKGNWKIQVDGNKTEVVKGTVTETYKETLSTTVTGLGTKTIKVTGSELTEKNSEAELIPLTTHVHPQGADSAGHTEQDTGKANPPS